MVTAAAQRLLCASGQGGGQISRAHFKLEQIDQRFRIVKPKQRVLELGAAPGNGPTT